MQIAYASQRSIFSFYISGWQARLSDFFFQFQAFLAVCCGCPVFDCQVFVQKHSWKWKRPSKRRDEVAIKKVFFKFEVSRQMLSTCTNLVVSGNSRAQVPEQILSISPIRKFPTGEVYYVKLEPRILTALKPRPRLAKVAAHLAGIMQFLPLTHSWVNSKHSSPSCLRLLCMYPREA